MRIENLPSPGIISTSEQLRREAARAISYVETVAAVTQGGKVSSAKSLSTFFAACKSAADAVADTTAPTITARAISAAAPDQIKLTMSEPLNATVVPANSAFTLASPAKTVKSIQISQNVVTITVTAAYTPGDTAPTVAYTAPGTNALRDVSGNLLASSGATVISRVP